LGGKKENKSPLGFAVLKSGGKNKSANSRGNLRKEEKRSGYMGNGSCYGGKKKDHVVEYWRRIQKEKRPRAQVSQDQNKKKKPGEKGNRNV